MERPCLLTPVLHEDKSHSRRWHETASLLVTVTLPPSPIHTSLSSQETAPVQSWGLLASERTQGTLEGVGESKGLKVERVHPSVLLSFYPSGCLAA